MGYRRLQSARAETRLKVPVLFPPLKKGGNLDSPLSRNSAMILREGVASWRRPDKRLVKKALRPLIYPRIFSYGVLLIGVVLFIANIKKIGNFLDSSAGVGPLLDAISKMTQILPYFFLPMVVVIISMLFCVFVVAFEKRKKTA